MKTAFIALSVVTVFLLIGIIYLFTNRATSIAVLPTPTPIEASPTAMISPTQPSVMTSPTTSQPSYCTDTDLQTLVSLDAGAGNIYGTLTLKNTSSTPCQISSSNFVTPKYTVTNITVAHSGSSGPALTTLAPGQTVYSQVHYPNGPQCQGPVKQAQISFTYPISPSGSVTFKDQAGSMQQVIQVCAVDSQQTQVDVWSISSTQISG